MASTKKTEATVEPTVEFVALPIDPKKAFWVTSGTWTGQVTRLDAKTYNVLGEGQIVAEADWATAYTEDAQVGKGRVCSTHKIMQFVRPSGQSGCKACSDANKSQTAAKRAAAKASAAAAVVAAAAAAAAAPATGETKVA